MKRVMHWMLGISLVMMIVLGALLYHTYRKSLTTDTTLLELNTKLYQNPLKERDGKADKIAFNLIFYTSKGNSELTDVVIEVLNCKKLQLSYIRIPMDTRIEVPAELYQKLTANYPEMPQYFKLSQLRHLFSKKKRYAYGQIILEEAFSYKFSSYVVLHGEQDTFEEYRKDLIAHSTSEKRAASIIKEVYPSATSNLSKKKKLKYSKYYDQLQTKDIFFFDLEGEKHTDYFEPDQTQFQLLVSRLQAGNCE